MTFNKIKPLRERVSKITLALVFQLMFLPAFANEIYRVKIFSSNPYDPMSLVEILINVELKSGKKKLPHLVGKYKWIEKDGCNDSYPFSGIRHSSGGFTFSTPISIFGSTDPKCILTYLDFGDHIINQNKVYDDFGVNGIGMTGSLVPLLVNITKTD